jgi:hypothetical protein
MQSHAIARAAGGRAELARAVGLDEVGALNRRELPEVKSSAGRRPSSAGRSGPSVAIGSGRAHARASAFAKRPRIAVGCAGSGRA